MINVKEIIIKVIPAKYANDFIKKNHYSKKVVPNSKLHFGVFYKDILHGVMSFGSSINKKGTMNLIIGTKWNEFIELNRMAFDDSLPKNSESRAISVAIKLIKKRYPHIKWIISFADATQCGDGTIYRASGFYLAGISKNSALRIDKRTGSIMHVIQAYHKKLTKEFKGWQAVEGYQLKYVYLIDKKCKPKTPFLSFNEIDKFGAGMYRGQKRNLCAESSKSEQAISNSKVAENYRPQRSIITKPKIKKLATNK